VRTAALNQQQQTQHVSVFTTELFAHYLHIRCLSVMKCRQLTQESSTGKIHRYRICVYELQEMLTTDVLVFNYMKCTKYLSTDKRYMVVGDQVPLKTSHNLDTYELVGLLQQSAVEHLTTYRKLEGQKIGSVIGIVTTDFDALYAYKCGEYQRCLQLSAHNVHTLIGVFLEMSCVCMYPEFIQLMDVDIVSLIGLMLIVNRSYRDAAKRVPVSQLSLSLYLMAQCQIKLHHPVTSLAQTFNYVEVARRNLQEGTTLDQLLLKLTERKMLLYVGRELV